MKRTILPVLALLAVLAACADGPRASTTGSTTDDLAFDAQRDLISLHYDHAPDKDDGHSAVADRTLLETVHGADWIARHVLAVSGAYGENAETFDVGSDAVMNATWNDVGGWVDAHRDHAGAVDALVERWTAVLQGGGDVWVKEGGQSDLTAEVVERLRQSLPDDNLTARVHVVQHSDWNEEQTTDEALAYTKERTDYIRIDDANEYLNRTEGNAAFVEQASAHPVFGPMWEAAFDYYDPNERLDFSDTGELLHILGIGPLGIDAFAEQYLTQESR